MTGDETKWPDPDNTWTNTHAWALSLGRDLRASSLEFRNARHPDKKASRFGWERFFSFRSIPEPDQVPAE